MAGGAFVPCTPTQPESSGWVAPRGTKSVTLAERVGGHLLLQLCTERRALPASAQLSSVQFSPGELRWQAPAVTNDRIEAAREPLRQQGYQLVADGTYWVLRTEVRP